MPRGKEHVIQRFRVQMRLCSIEHQRFGGMFSAVAKFVSDGQRLVRCVGTGFTERIGPEELVARVVEFCAGQQRVGTIQIIDGIGKGSIAISVESPVIAILKIVDTGFTRLPTGGGAKYQPWPGHVDERFAVIVPGGVERAHSLMLLAVANKIPDVHKGAFEVGPDDAPVRLPRAQRLREDRHWCRE